MSGLPRKFIKKYGVTKKAWSEFRKSKHKTVSRYRTEVKPMARHRTRRTYRAKARRAYHRASQTSIKNLMIGMSVASVLEPFGDSALDKFLPATALGGVDVKDLLKGIGGYYAQKKTSGIIKGIATGFALIGARNVARSLIGQAMGAPAQTSNAFVQSIY